MSGAWRSVTITDLGKIRERNEDAYFVDPERGIFLVADGMGGHAAGEVASALAAGAVARELERVPPGAGPELAGEAMERGIARAHREIAECCENEPATRGMGTTLTACLLHPEGSYTIGHIGDSRAYVLRDGRLEQITRDHTWVQHEVDAGRVSEAAARTHRLSHILSRVLAAESPWTPDIVRGTLLPGDLLALVTDGLSGPVDDPTITEVLLGPGDLPARAAELVARAHLAGAPDNVTAVLVEFLGA